MTSSPQQMAEQYRSVVKRPDDFDEFWDALLAQVAQIPLHATQQIVPIRCTSEVEVFLVHYNSLDDVRIAGWYCLPRPRSGPLPAIVHLPGYISEPAIPRHSARMGYASFGVITRGKLRSNDQFNPGFPGLLTHNIVDRNTYSYRGLYIDAVRAIDFLLSREEIDGSRIGVTGGSQGGGLTVTTAALRPEVRAAAASAPFLCGFMDSIDLTHTYPYQEIRDYLRIHPEKRAVVENVLAYFDVINFATRVTCPIIVNIGLQDNVCPAETGFALFHSLASEQKRMFPYDGHGHEAGRSHHSVIVDDFFKTHLKP